MTPTKVALVFLFILKPSLIAQEYIEQATPPWGYIFKGWKGPPIDVINYFPASATKSSPILIIIPGASRDAQRFHASWLDLAKKKSFIVLTIGARKKYFPDEYSYNAGRLISSQGYAMDKSQWLFSAIEPLFEDFKKRYKLNTEKFYLFGHSAGGGFVHRYLLFKPEAPVVKAVAANPAFVTVPDFDIQYPFGLKNTPIKKRDIKPWFKHNLAIVLGEDDLGPRTKPLSNGAMANVQGVNCFERGQLLFSAAEQASKSIRAKFNWKLITVPNVGHDNFKIAPVASNYLFGK
tara:strand:- start:850 stop:1722 length:873 start_codon:yes stop_codon:yes gene_type:complete